MKKIIFFLSLLPLLVLNAFGQTSDEYHKNEVSGGYLYRQPNEITNNTRVFRTKSSNVIVTDNTFPNPAKLKFQGFNTAYTYNFHRYVGVKGEFSGVYNNEELRFAGFIPPVFPIPTDPNVKIKSSLYNYVGGIQIKDNSKKTRFKPFAHAMFGVGHERKILDCFGSPKPIVCTNPARSSQKSFSAVLGGGIDIKLSDRIDIRAIQFDFNPMKIVSAISNPPIITKENSNKYRIGFGIVFH
jgi:hypothetical protein